MMKPSLSLCMEVVQLAQKISEKIMKIYTQNENISVQKKADASPLSQADLLAHDLITQGLKSLTPNLPVLSEESAPPPFMLRKTWPAYWLIDPLDGTKEFLAHTDDFSINIALIVDHLPVLGVVAVPARELIYYAVDQKAWKRFAQQAPSQMRLEKNKKVKSAVISRTHHQDEEIYLKTHFQLREIMRVGSAYKFCLVAEGKADIYVRLSPTYEWDTAAGQCILTAAGGEVQTLDGETLTYNIKENLLNPFFIAHAVEQF